LEFDAVERLPDHERTDHHEHISFPHIPPTPSPSSAILRRNPRSPRDSEPPPLT
jgi:hypothetical protein